MSENMLKYNVDLHSERWRLSLQIAPPGTCQAGITKIPFSIPLRAPAENPSTPLYETYHGINLNVQVRPASHAPSSC